MKNLGNMLKQAQAMQQKMGEMQERLAAMEVEGQAGGGMVRATISGRHEIKRVKIDKSLVDPAEIEMLEDLVVAACNDARVKVEAAVAEETQKLTAGLPLPPGMKFPF